MLGLLGLLLILSYTAPVQRWAFDLVVAQLEDRAGIVVRAERVAFSPLGFRAALDGVSIASRVTPATPYFTATHVDIDARWGVLRGQPIFERVRIVNPVVDVARVAAGNGPRPHSARSSRSSAVMVSPGNGVTIRTKYCSRSET